MGGGGSVRGHFYGAERAPGRPCVVGDHRRVYDSGNRRVGIVALRTTGGGGRVLGRQCFEHPGHIALFRLVSRLRGGSPHAAGGDGGLGSSHFDERPPALAARPFHVD